MSDKSIEAIIRELADRESIRELTHRYADCVWRRDPAGAVALFAEDGEMDTGDRPPIKGRAALAAEYQKMLTGPELQPFVHNQVIDLNGDSATGRCYLDLRATADGVAMIGSGHYQDEYVRVAGEWKFRSRKLTMSFFVPFQEGWGE